MNSEKDSPANQIDELACDNSPSIDDFIKELEAKEKDLHISSDMVVEVEASDIGEDDVYELLKVLDKYQGKTAASGAASKPVETSYQPYNANVSHLEDEVEKLRQQVYKFETERSEVSEIARRRQYDFDNYRKRTEREKSEMYSNFLSSVAMEILPVLDNLSRALDSASNLQGEKSKDFQQFVDGVGLVNLQLNEVLGEMGIQPIISVGEPFDPHFHEAVAAVKTSAYPPHIVIAELLRGYRLNDKVIRPSLVKVSASPNPETE
jgi:molecular chaperone GrpE